MDKGPMDHPCYVHLDNPNRQRSIEQLILRNFGPFKISVVNSNFVPFKITTLDLKVLKTCYNNGSEPMQK